ncbi:MAG: type II toxin-antitoxin system VapC family toxin [Gemmatimonadales bacterium]
MTVLADTGAIYALVDRDDAWHDRIRTWWEPNREPIRLPVTILPEVAWLLGTRIGPAAEAAFARALAGGEFALEPLDEAVDLPRIAALAAAYLDTPIGFVDASILAMTERLGVVTLLTTDRRHFGVLRPRHVPSLKLVP